jgi:lysozyme family protein
MASQNLPAALDVIRDVEGGYVDHPKDPGGCTNFGITIGTYRAYYDPFGVCRDLRYIDRNVVEQIYRKHYWGAVRGDGLPSGIDLAVFDFAVNSGPARAIQHLQRLVGTKPDGFIGPITLRAVEKAAWSKWSRIDLVNNYCDSRLSFLEALRNWRYFGRGWANRVRIVRAAALALVY